MSVLATPTCRPPSTKTVLAGDGNGTFANDLDTGSPDDLMRKTLDVRPGALSDIAAPFGHVRLAPDRAHWVRSPAFWFPMIIEHWRAIMRRPARQAPTGINFAEVFGTRAPPTYLGGSFGRAAGQTVARDRCKSWQPHAASPKGTRGKSYAPGPRPHRSYAAPQNAFMERTRAVAGQEAYQMR